MLLVIAAAFSIYFEMTGFLKPEYASDQNNAMDQASEDFERIQVPPLEFKNYTASFEIYTNGTKRVFTQPMYHEQSSAVYIQAADPSIIFIAEEDVTWNDFFSTLPFSVSHDCLVTGTGQSFCTGEGGILSFYLNDVLVDDVLGNVIEPYQKLVIKFE